MKKAKQDMLRKCIWGCRPTHVVRTPSPNLRMSLRTRTRTPPHHAALERHPHLMDVGRGGRCARMREAQALGRAQPHGGVRGSTLARKAIRSVPRSSLSGTKQKIVVGAIVIGRRTPAFVSRGLRRENIRCHFHRRSPPAAPGRTFDTTSTDLFTLSRLPEFEVPPEKTCENKTEQSRCWEGLGELRLAGTCCFVCVPPFPRTQV